MNYFAARQRESDKRWDYTCKNDGTIWPVGYCGGWREPQTGLLTPEQVQQWVSQAAPHRHKFHLDGHATAEEACDCYKQYLLDFDLRLGGEALNTQRKCEVCGAWTSRFARVGHRTWFLCDEHRTREHVEALFGPVGESWES